MFMFNDDDNNYEDDDVDDGYDNDDDNNYYDDVDVLVNAIVQFQLMFSKTCHI